ncbi:MAG: GNAT family N-acetyltransferase [Planctomycetota bacterium]
MDEAPRCCLHRELTDEQALAIGALMASTWPKPEKDAAYRAASLIRKGIEKPRRPELASRSFFLCDGDRVVAHAAMQPRELATEAGPLWVLGLGAVCTDGERRGEGLGARIVEAALAMVDDGLAPFSLFQTSHAVRPFYEKLGCCLVENRIINSEADDPEANPFWDEVAMRYPAGPGWPDGVIDLRGPGY